MVKYDFTDSIDTRKISESSSVYRVSINAIIIENKKLLVVKEKEGYYGLPGGGLEYDSSIHDSLKRELEEEISAKNVNIHDSPLLAAPNGVHEGIPRFSVYFVAEIDTATIASNELMFKWVAKEDLKTLELAQDLYFVKEFMQAML